MKKVFWGFVGLFILLFIAPVYAVERISVGVVDSPTDPKFENNIKNAIKALEYLEGTEIKPGEIFSFNKTIGKRTISRGFYMGLSGSEGDYYKDVGGGVCQAATAIHRAVVNAGLQVVERHRHLNGALYAPNGDDAAVDWDARWDYKFKNTLPYTIVITAHNDNNKIQVEFIKKEDLESAVKNYNVKLFINDVEIKFDEKTGKPFIAFGRTYIPYEAIARSIGSDITYRDKKVIMKFNKNLIEFTINSYKYKVNGKIKEMDVVPYILKSDRKVYIPIKFLLDELGFTINGEIIDDMFYIKIYTYKEENYQTAFGHGYFLERRF
ncbi:MAG TPA: hypothetical protein GXX15_03835 [Clostridia bacterium]|nr:hypothetical protein [Clostridia bacterium]